MIGVVLVAHGNLATEFLNVCEHIMGKQERVQTVCIAAGDDMEKRREDIMRAVEFVDAGSGVVILTDMFGGTPSNLAISVMNSDKIEVLAGMNLPMLIKLISVRGALPLSQVVIQSQESGRKYVNIARNLLKKS
ncbi:MAG: PTS sugar transporter subunit IIA [Rickettsiales bacterium]|nr:PTS sugar transporter subunit IIA [Rickettsiales bacterium]